MHFYLISNIPSQLPLQLTALNMDRLEAIRTRKSCPQLSAADRGKQTLLYAKTLLNMDSGMLHP